MKKVYLLTEDGTVSGIEQAIDDIIDGYKKRIANLEAANKLLLGVRRELQSQVDGLKAENDRLKADLTVIRNYAPATVERALRLCGRPRRNGLSN